jgi:DNA-binding SARP family transcriptional activator
LEPYRFGEAVNAALLAVSAEPLRESAQRALIEADVAEGNLAEANRSFRYYRDLVFRELGVEPPSNLHTFLGPVDGVRSRQRVGGAS